MTSPSIDDGQVGPPAPFDPELADALTELRQRILATLTEELLVRRRADIGGHRGIEPWCGR